MRTLNYILVGMTFLVYVMIFGGEGIKAMMFFLPFTMSPFFSTSRTGQKMASLLESGCPGDGNDSLCDMQ